MDALTIICIEAEDRVREIHDMCERVDAAKSAFCSAYATALPPPARKMRTARPRPAVTPEAAIEAAYTGLSDALPQLVRDALALAPEGAASAESAVGRVHAELDAMGRVLGWRFVDATTARDAIRKAIGDTLDWAKRTSAAARTEYDALVAEEGV